MKLSIVTSTVACIAAATTNIASASTQNDIINQHLKEKAMASGNTELLDHLNDFTQLKEDAAARRLVEGDTVLDTAVVNDNSIEAMKHEDKKCFFGFATETFKHFQPRGATHTRAEGDDADIYWWGTNAVCDDEETGNITWVPTTPFSDGETQIYEPSYCAESTQDINARLIGSATGHCFLSPVRIDEENYGGNTTGCNEKGPCEWSCQEVMVIPDSDGRDDYLFLQYIYKPAEKADEIKYDSVHEGDFPDLFDVVVTGGTGCYNIDRPRIIPGYTAYGVIEYVYDLSALKKARNLVCSSGANVVYTD